MSKSLRDAALEYHRRRPHGKLEIRATKPMTTPRDLSLAYSPGVAAACEEIARDPTEAASLTARGNLVAVVSNGTAVLGLGAIGALAAKPVMEGKAVLFKNFADIDAFDIEIEERDPERFVEVVAGLEASFGGINLEDIRAPECFTIEEALRRRMNIPVFHDDQHGTAIVVGAALLNGLEVVGKRIDEVRLVCCGAGAAALSCLNMAVELGLARENITVVDIDGVVYAGREEGMDPWKARYAVETEARTLAEAVAGADVFLGLSAGGVLRPEMVASMADRPLILALANPQPEILPEEARAVRDDVVMATGRSDYPNQVNNVMCFPFIFRGALDAGATEINEQMKIACVHAIAALARTPAPDTVSSAYSGQSLRFGPDYILPKPFDPRLIEQIPPAVARAAMESGVATRPVADLEAYRHELSRHVVRSANIMKPVFERVRRDPKRIVFAEGEEPRVLQAAEQMVDQGLARPVLVGRERYVTGRLRELGLRLEPGRDFDLIDPEDEERFSDLWQAYHALTARKGVSPADARTIIRTQNTAIAALKVVRGRADGMVCGTVGRFLHHLRHVADIIGRGAGVRDLSTLSIMILEAGTFFICDSHVTPDPSDEEIAEMAQLAAREVEHFGLVPKVALVSHSTFGSYDTASSLKMRRALEILRRRAPQLEVEGEMQVEAALSESVRQAAFPGNGLSGRANLLVMPNIDAANIACGLLKMVGGGMALGPVLIGTAHPAHIVEPSVTVRGLLDITALTVAQAQYLEQQRQQKEAMPA
ncbi:MAG: NADP-dependent malic enzyme [Gammaproteobacteria bacterium]|nr:MAG: NADP-dependent malic enzyme [Gammaproteobacteria bacterium]